MSDAIRNLDDVAAQRILEAIARSHARADNETVRWSPGLAHTLAQEFQLERRTLLVSEGELARQALLVLAEDPETRKRIEAMAVGTAGSAQKFDFGTMGITAAVLIVLQTHVRFEHNSDGTWSLKLEKKPTSDTLLKGLVQKLITFAK